MEYHLHIRYPMTDTAFEQHQISYRKEVMQTLQTCGHFGYIAFAYLITGHKRFPPQYSHFLK